MKKIILVLPLLLLVISCASRWKITPMISIPPEEITTEEEPRLVLHDIEVINAETKETRLDVEPGDKIKLKAIPHSYTIEGEDVGDKIPDFNPKWSAPDGTFVPSDGPEVIFVVPYNIGGAIGFWIDVKQTNVEGKVIKGSIWVDTRW